MFYCYVAPTCCQRLAISFQTNNVEETPFIQFGFNKLRLLIENVDSHEYEHPTGLKLFIEEHNIKRVIHICSNPDKYPPCPPPGVLSVPDTDQWC